MRLTIISYTGQGLVQTHVKELKEDEDAIFTSKSNPLET